ncbi:tudor domain-containing 6-like [Oreochromis aureus]|uniref:Tudor domain-containing protein n=1 Tax=Oreochromis aureus TaxID=47969 RepID=A0A668VUP6_OREAU|nr:tudor domain-containing 6-like [Oreochromis aureus]
MCSIPGLPAPGTEIPVLIVRVNLKPNCGLVELWVNMDDEKKHIYEQMREEIQTPHRKFSGLEGKPGDLCLVCISETWHRARIVSIESQTYNLFLIDQGQPHIATNEVLAWAQNDSFLLPPEIECCILANILSLEKNFPDRATKFLMSLPGKKFKGLVQYVLMPDRTILLDIPVVSKHMCKSRVAKKFPVEEFKNIVLKCLNLPNDESSEAFDVTQEQSLNVSSQFAKHNQYFYPELLTDILETVYVTEVIDPENIFCQLLILSKAVKILSEQMHQHYEEHSNFGEELPQSCGDPCAAKGTDGRWHRSLLKQNIETCDGAVKVFHVDEGKNALVPVEDIRPLAGKFLKMPVITYRCSLNGIKENGREWTAVQTDLLKSLLLNKTVVVTFDHYDATQDVYNVALYAANATCVNSSFLEKADFIPLYKHEQDLIVQNESINSSFLSLLEDEQCMNLQNKVNVIPDGVPEGTAPSSKNKTANGGQECACPSCNSDIYTKASSEPAVDRNGHTAPGLCAELQSACHDSAFAVGSSVNVKVSCIESLQKFWCQMTENEDSLGCLMQDLQNHCSSTLSQPLVQSICVARNPDNNMWYRARIVANSNSPVVDVRFIDYGQIKKVPLQDVHPIDPAFLRLSTQAFPCCLVNLKSPTYPVTTTWNSDALAEFHKFVDLSALTDDGLKCIVKAVESDGEGLLLNMVDIQTASGSACELLDKKCAQSEAHLQCPPQVTSDMYNYSTYNIEVGGKENVWITSSETVNHFYCQLDRNAKLFDKLMESVAQLLSEPQRSDQTLGLNSLCFARYTDNEWYRGQLVEITPKLKVHFVDYGDTLVVSETDICPFPTEVSVARSFPVQAIPLGLFDVPAELPQEVNQWFADRVVGRSFTISVAKVENGKRIVELYDGSVSVNMKVRERMAKTKQNKMTNVIQQTDQHHFNSLNEGCSAQESVLVETAGQNGVHGNDKMSAADDLKQSSKFTVDVASPRIEHATVLDEGTKPIMHVTLEDKTVAETSVQICHSDSDKTQHSNSCLEKNLTICMYNWPNISQKQIEDVYASCIVGPHYFWCQYNTEDLNMISKLAQETGQIQDAVFPEVLVPGSPCLALFSSDNQWYRAQVIQKTDNTLNVLFIDYGNESEVSIKDVRSIPQHLLEIPPQAFLCFLDGFKSEGSWDDDVYDDFYNLLVDKPLKLTVINKEKYSEMAVPQYAVNIECDKIFINSLAQKNGKSLSGENSENQTDQAKSFSQSIQTENNTTHFDVAKGNDNPCMYKEPQLSQNDAETVYASCIGDPFYFWCQYANTEGLHEVSQLVQEAGEAQKDMMLHETPRPGSPCLAVYSSDNQWYRAQVIEKADSTLHVLFIDYGNESEIDIRNIRSLSQPLLEKAPQAFLCCLNGFKESEGSWNDSVYDDFYTLLINKPLNLRVISIGNHSVVGVPQYHVEIECEGVAVNTLMQKYWNPVTEECVGAESHQTENLPQAGQTEPDVNQICVAEENVFKCMYKEPQLSPNDTEMVYASCIVGPHFFWCQYANTEDLCKVSQLAQEAGEAQQKLFPETAGPGSPCLALYSDDNQWYRAQVIEKADTSLHVVFIDYGNESQVDIGNIRSLPQTLLEKAPQAFLCCLNEFKESEESWDDTVYDEFFNLVINKPLRLTVISIGDHSEITIPQYHVKIECEGVDVNKQMQKYWKGVARDGALAESVESVYRDETSAKDKTDEA